MATLSLIFSTVNLQRHTFSYYSTSSFCSYILKGTRELGFGRRPQIEVRSNRDKEIEIGSEEWLVKATPYQILGVKESCSLEDLRVAFRARVKEYHPDVCKHVRNSHAIMLRVIEAYGQLSEQYNWPEIFERESFDPFEKPECEALDLFVNGTLCIGKGCPYSCVRRAPHAFAFAPATGTARATLQAHGDDYQVQLAVGQCPRNCIHYVTPSQRIILEELLESILTSPLFPPEATILDSLIARANFENNRYSKPKRKPKGSTQYVDYY
ncbi:hypothetical protein AMTRI_Chr12g269220 [Amborella trichopoda]|uniref:uncharacterized protein LOC18431791 isoform X2 n=1 Tax=Amborella trichopoda TaxID=13333 RepID=UPI0005D33EA3|nr:uncharacterized protein LOC18431791 isoform X2 [Amborella trichopoda]|eukprot:XP_011622434.1 uncharacterized protein LOC18431791 isoform X2 [Amborella trichopoda]